MLSFSIVNIDHNCCELKRQVLPLDCLSLFLILSLYHRLMYASPSWSGYITVQCLSTIQKLFNKSVKWAVTSKSYQAADLFADRNEKLFSAMCTWTNHCLHHLLLSERDTGHNLRQRTFLSVGLLQF